MIKPEENTKASSLVCEACGLKFTCNANDIENCFCNKVILSKEIIKQIQNTYNHCLCENCLKLLQKASF